MPDASKADDKALNQEKVEIGDWGACYYDKYWGLVQWVDENLPAPKGSVPPGPPPVAPPPAATRPQDAKPIS